MYSQARKQKWKHILLILYLSISWAVKRKNKNHIKKVFIKKNYYDKFDLPSVWNLLAFGKSSQTNAFAMNPMRLWILWFAFGKYDGGDTFVYVHVWIWFAFGMIWNQRFHTMLWNLLAFGKSKASSNKKIFVPIQSSMPMLWFAFGIWNLRFHTMLLWNLLCPCYDQSKGIIKRQRPLP